MDREAYSSYCGGGPLSAGMIAIGSSDTGNDLVVAVVGSSVGDTSGAMGDAGGNAVGNSAGDIVPSTGAVFGTVAVPTAESVIDSAAVAGAMGTVESLLFSMVGSPSVAR